MSGGRIDRLAKNLVVAELASQVKRSSKESSLHCSRPPCALWCCCPCVQVCKAKVKPAKLVSKKGTWLKKST
eukprot:867851-Amphidinium_carterae.1